MRKKLEIQPSYTHSHASLRERSKSALIATRAKIPTPKQIDLLSQLLSVDVSDLREAGITDDDRRSRAKRDEVSELINKFASLMLNVPSIDSHLSPTMRDKAIDAAKHFGVVRALQDMRQVDRIAALELIMAASQKDGTDALLDLLIDLTDHKPPATEPAAPTEPSNVVQLRREPPLDIETLLERVEAEPDRIAVTCKVSMETRERLKRMARESGVPVAYIYKAAILHFDELMSA